MYQALLTRRYLTTKVMPLLAVMAVMLCTAMVLIVSSIMGGFLTVLLTSGRALAGDVIVSWPTSGFGHYQDLIERLEADPRLAAATPMVETGGVVKLPDGRQKYVIVRGIEPASYARVTNFDDTLWWRPLEKPLPKDRGREDPRLGDARSAGAKTRDDPRFDDPALWAEMLENGRTLSMVDPETGERKPAAVAGIEVSGFNERMAGGWYRPAGAVGRRLESGQTEWMNGFFSRSSLVLNLLALDSRGRAANSVTREFPVVNEVRTGIFEIDEGTVVLPLADLQRMLKMDEAERIADERGGTPWDFDDGGEQPLHAPPTVETIPARVTTVLAKAERGVDLREAVEAAREVYEEFAAAHKGEVPAGDQIGIATWEERQGTLVSAVKKEIALVLGIIVFISFVASFLIWAIFWAMVSEKTKDIGVLRSIGASRSGVAWLWLRYGLAIGIVGSIVGLALAYAIVWNINPIHDVIIAAGRRFGQNWAIWDPKVYYFSEIPHQVDRADAAMVFFGGLFFSVLGALVPSVRAARMDPVRALRFE